MTPKALRIDEALPRHNVGVQQPTRSHEYPTVLLKVLATLTLVSLVVNLAFSAGGLRFPLCEGPSNEPNVRDGQRSVFLKPWRIIRKGDLVLINRPDGLTLKRVDKDPRKDGAVWVRGDNRRVSFDSEIYGWVDRSRVVGLCVVRLPWLCDGPTSVELASRPAAAGQKQIEPEILTREYAQVLEKLTGREIKRYRFSLPDVFMGKVDKTDQTFELPTGTHYVSVCWRGQGVAYVFVGDKKATLAPTGQAAAEFITIPTGVNTISIRVIGVDKVRFKLTYYR